MAEALTTNTPPKISGRTQIVGLIGWPVGHSVSPAMHNAAFTHLGLDWCYVPLPVAPANVAAALRGLPALGMRGANVTVPHKQAVMPYLDELTDAATAIGAVNTIICRDDGRLVGDNADAPGFVADLRAHGVDPSGLRVLILGAGGSARAIAYGLLEAGVIAVTIANRTHSRSAEIVDAYQPRFADVPMYCCDLAAGLAAASASADLIVNCTSLGMTPLVDTSPWPDDLPMRRDQVVYDLVYNPARTRLLMQAERDGARTVGGIGMLIYQGALAFERWTGCPAPADIMRRASGR